MRHDLGNPDVISRRIRVPFKTRQIVRKSEIIDRNTSMTHRKAYLWSDTALERRFSFVYNLSKQGQCP